MKTIPSETKINQIAERNRNSRTVIPQAYPKASKFQKKTEILQRFPSNRLINNNNNNNIKDSSTNNNNINNRDVLDNVSETSSRYSS